MKKLLIVLCGVLTLCAKKQEPAIPSPTPAEIVAQYCMQEEIDHLFFAPDEGRIYKQLIRGLIQAADEQSTISIAAFRFTDKDLRDDLVAAHNRGIPTEIVFDHGAMTSTFYSLAFSLCDAGIAVYQYIPVGLTPLSQRGDEGHRISYQAIMHYKMMLFRNILGGKDIVVFGSLNFTTAGFFGNEEMVTVCNKPAHIGRIANQVEKLKQRSYSVETHRSGSRLPSLNRLKKIAVGIVRYVR